MIDPYDNVTEMRPLDGAAVLDALGYTESTTERPGWSMVDVTPVVDGLLDGSLEWPTPDVGRLTYASAQGGNDERPKGLFYRGHVNDVHGASNAAKTWLAVMTMAQEVEAREHVFYIDAEDNERTAVLRMLQAGATPEAIKVYFHYINPGSEYDDFARTQLLSWFDAVNPRLVVIDSTGESLGLDGADSNSDGEVTRWFSRLPRPLAKRGACVLLLDHVTKAAGEAAGRWDTVDATGSGRKRNGTDGASYYVHAVQAFAIGEGGASSIVCTKDRHGAYHRGQRIGVMVADPSERMRGTGLDVMVRPWWDMPDHERALYDPQAAEDGSDRKVRVMNVLPDYGQDGLGRNEVARLAGIDPKDAGTTLKKLSEDGVAVNSGTPSKASWTKVPTPT